MPALPIRDCISFGWRTFTTRPKIFIAAGLTLFAAIFIVNAADTTVATIAESLAGEGSAVALIIAGISSLIALGLSILIDMGQGAFFLKAHDKVGEVEIKNLYFPHHFWRYTVTSLVFGVVFVIGLILLIVPGIIFGLVFGFAMYRVIDTGCNVTTAFKESAALTKGNRWNLFLLGLALVGINILGFFALLIGLFVTLPVTVLALVHAYRTLEAAHMPVDSAAEEKIKVA